jgi:hypothetical protein
MEGRLETALETRWTDHLGTCSDCLTAVDVWREFRDFLKRPHLASAPQSLLASATALFQPQSQTEERRSLRQVIADLVYDSFAQPAFAGARGGTASQQIVMRAEEFDIHMSIWMVGENRELLGQIQPRGTATFIESARLHLVRNGERIGSAEADSFGEFHFSYVPNSPLSLQIDLPHLTVIGVIDTTKSN